MKRYLLIIGAILMGLSVRAQSVTYTCRYWFDKDHGQAVTTTFSESIWQEELDVGSLSDGLHTLHLQARDTSMRWSAPENFLFLKVSNIPTEQMPYIYWFDRDLANKQSGSLGNGQLFLDVDNLEAGLHTLHLMLNGTENSAVQNFLFLKVDAMGPDGESYTYHCWFDRDLANQQTDNLGTDHILLDVSGLTEGMHTVNVIVEGSTFSATESYLFVKVPPVENVSQLTCHYWFDRDFANHVTDSLGTGNLLVDVNGLTDGLHTLHVILEGTDLAATESYMFVKIAVQEPEQELQYNCWFDEDYNTLLTGSVGNGVFLVPVGMLPVGDHNLYMQVNDGTLSSPAVYPFYRTPMITITINPLETGLATSSLVDDTICTLVAVPNVGYEFQSWTQNGEVVSTDSEYTFTLLEDAEFVANFVLKSYDIAATANPADGGTVEGGGVYFHFSTCTMTATANTGYHFLNWTQDGVVVSDEPTFSIEVEGPASYVAHFELNSYEIVAMADPEEGGIVEGAGIYTHGEQAQLEAIPNEGYVFIGWMEDGEIITTTPNYGFTVTQPRILVASFELETYEIAAFASPEEGGIVEGAGTYAMGETCTLTATANEGYYFLHWVDMESEIVSYDMEYSFTVTEGATYYAMFELDVFEILAFADPEEGGTVTGAGFYNHGQNCTLTAVPNEGYLFVNWTRENEVVSEEETYSFVVTGNAEFVANFEATGGEITQASTFVNGWTWWSTCIETTEADVLGQLKSGLGASGQVIKSQTASTMHLGNYWVGSLTMTNESGYMVKSNAEVAVEITGPAANPEEHPITILPGWTWIGYPSSEEVSINEALSNLTPSAYDVLKGQECFAFYHPTAGWCGTLKTMVPGMGLMYKSSNNESLSFTYSSGISNPEPNITADDNHWVPNMHQFDQNMTVTGVLEIDGVEMASDQYEIGAFCGDECRGSVRTVYVAPLNRYLVLLTLSSEPGDYVYFRLYDHENEEEVVGVGLSYLTYENNGIVGLPFDDPYVFGFQTVNHYTVTLQANPATGGTVTGGGTIVEGETCMVTATPNSHYTFLNWTKNGEVVSTNYSYSFTVTENVTLVANFELNSYDITATSNPEAGGTVTGAGTYDHGTTATLTATANEGYTFLNWTLDGEVVSNETTYSFEVTGPASFVANFELNSYEITVTANPTEGGTVTGAGTYNHFSTCTLTATANEGYTFLNWTLDGEAVSNEATYSFEVTGPASFVANFELNSYEITVTANPTEGGTVTGAGTYNHFSTCTLTATANEGYTFLNWTQGDSIVSTEETYSFTVTEAAAFVANFEATITDITQTSDFVVGWTWWSSSIETEEADVLDQLKTGLGASGQVIKSQTQSTMHMGNNWFGALTMTNESGYMVKSNAEVAVEITGPAATPENHPISLNVGWTWIGYPCTEAMTVAEALANHTPHPNDVIKGQSVSAMFMAGAWRGALTLTPGMGLMYKSNSSEVVPFTYATPNRMTEAEAIAVEPHWNADYSAYPTNMTVLAVVELNGEELNSENYELSAFANGECRGSVAMMYVEPLDRYMALLTISGEVADNLHFGLYNTETGEECFATDETLTYETDAVIGSPDEPFVIRFRNTTGMDEWANSLQVFPNPVEHGQTITFGMADDMGEVQVEIINALGMVETRRATSLQTIAAPNVAGVYTLRITVEGKGTCYRKLIVR